MPARPPIGSKGIGDSDTLLRDLNDALSKKYRRRPDRLAPWRKAGDALAQGIWTGGIVVTALKFWEIYGWWVGLLVFFALIHVAGIHRELIRRRPEGK